MYSREQRMKAIRLYIKYDKCRVDVIRELGYPSRNLLTLWYKAFLNEQKTGVVWDRYTRKSIYSQEQKKAAVDHYLEHGCNLSRTIRLLGYPSKEALRQWCDELAPGTRKLRGGGIQYTKEQKKEAVIELCTRTGNASSIAKKYDVTRNALYKWKKELLDEEDCIPLNKQKNKPYSPDKDALMSEIEILEKQVKRLRMENAILEKAAEIIKKDPGVNLRGLKNKEMAILIDALRDEYPLNELIESLGIVRSNYFYHHKKAFLPDKYEKLRNDIITIFNENKGRYGYRRIYAKLLNKGKRVSEKVVRRIMSEANLCCCWEKETQVQFISRRRATVSR